MEGKTISGYTIKKRLGIGGMAEVWYAENKIGKNAAVKVLLPELCRNTNIVERFVTEAKTMVMLNHPNIRQVYDYGDIDGCPAIVMEYLDGDDLKAKMKQGMRFTDEELIKWWNQLVDALKYTHSKGVVHRDIKPGNIFVDKEGNIKLLDFGIAKVRESITSTQTGQKLGTLMYMSPEQVRDSKHIDYHTDIYSLAVTFVHLVTGRKPYDSDTYSDFDIQTSIVSKPLDLSEMPEKWQNFLAPYLNKEASKRPELRYFDENAPAPTPKPVANDEATVYDEGPAKPEPVAKPEPPKKTENIKPVGNSPKKNKTGLWITLGIVAVVALVLLLVLPGKKNDSATDTSSKNSENSLTVREEMDDGDFLVNDEKWWQYMPNYGEGSYDHSIHYVKDRNLMTIFINSNGTLLVDGMPMNVSELKDAVKKFITPNPYDERYPEVEVRDISYITNDGIIVDRDPEVEARVSKISTVVTNKAIISVCADDNISKTACASVIKEISQAYLERSDEIALNYFNTHYSDVFDDVQMYYMVAATIQYRVVGIGDYSDCIIKAVDNSLEAKDVFIDNSFLIKCICCITDKDSSVTINDMIDRFEEKNSKKVIIDLATKEKIEKTMLDNTHETILDTMEYYIEEDIEEEEEIFVSVEEQPEFPGGPAKLMEFVQRNLKYPMQARESDIQGRVYVGFVVEKDGSVSNVEVLRGIGGGCDEEAVRVVESLPKFKPGKQRGNPVRVRYTLSVVFKLQ